MINGIKKILSKTTLAMSQNSLIKCSGKRLVSPFYHLVSDESQPHIKHLYPVLSVKRFNADLDFFEKYYQPIDADTLVENIQSGKEFNQPVFFLSFDDGLRPFYEVVAPILLRRGIPATCFINTAFVDNKDLFFRLKASLLIDAMNDKTLTKAEFSLISQLASSVGLSYFHPADLLKITFQTQAVLNKMAEVIDVDFQDYLNKQKPYLTTEQIKELQGKGFTIGAHSVSHPYYADLTEDDQVAQTLESLNYVKEHFQPTKQLFSFPFNDLGVNKSFFDRIEHAVDMTFGTASLKLDSVKFNLQRMPMENANYHNAEDTVKTGYLVFSIKKMLGKHIIYRK